MGKKETPNLVQKSCKESLTKTPLLTPSQSSVSGKKFVSATTAQESLAAQESATTAQESLFWRKEVPEGQKTCAVKQNYIAQKPKVAKIQQKWKKCVQSLLLLWINICISTFQK